MRLLVAALPLALLALTGCPGEPASPTVTVPDGGGSSVEPVEAGSDPVTQVDAGPKLCGCALCEPLVSDDDCKSDGDCAPLTACHAKACVAKAKAQPRASNTACTEDFQCNAVEANPCSCFHGKCALVPRPKNGKE